MTHPSSSERGHVQAAPREVPGPSIGKLDLHPVGKGQRGERHDRLTPRLPSRFLPRQLEATDLRIPTPPHRLPGHPARIGTRRQEPLQGRGAVLSEQTVASPPSPLPPPDEATDPCLVERIVDVPKEVLGPGDVPPHAELPDQHGCIESSSVPAEHPKVPSQAWTVLRPPTEPHLGLCRIEVRRVEGAARRQGGQLGGQPHVHSGRRLDQ